jgi:hypothetical protein
VVTFLYYDLYDKLKRDMDKLDRYISVYGYGYVPTKPSRTLYVRRIREIGDIPNLINTLDFYDTHSKFIAMIESTCNYDMKNYMIIDNDLLFTERKFHDEILILLYPKIIALDNGGITDVYRDKIQYEGWECVFNYKLP